MSLNDKLAHKQKELSSLSIKYEFIALVGLALVFYMSGGSMVKTIEHMFFDVVEAVNQLFSMRLTESAKSVLSKTLSVLSIFAVVDTGFTYFKRLKQDTIVKSVLEVLHEQAVEYKRAKDNEGLDCVLSNLMALNNVNPMLIREDEGALSGASRSDSSNFFQYAVVLSKHSEAYFGHQLFEGRSRWYLVTMFVVWALMAINTPHFLVSQFIVVNLILIGWRVGNRVPSLGALSSAYDKVVSAVCEDRMFRQYETLPPPTLRGLKDVKPSFFSLLNKLTPYINETAHLGLKVLFIIATLTGYVLLVNQAHSLRGIYPLVLNESEQAQVSTMVDKLLNTPSCKEELDKNLCLFGTEAAKDALQEFYSAELQYSIPLVVTYNWSKDAESDDCAYKGYQRVLVHLKSGKDAGFRDYLCINPLLQKAIKD